MGIALLGLAVVAAFVGIAWVCAEHWCVRNIPNELWFGGGAIVGVFVGSLVSVPLPRPRHPRWDRPAAILTVLSLAIAFVLGTLAVDQADSHSYEQAALYVTFAGVLLGLPIPSPGRRDG